MENKTCPISKAVDLVGLQPLSNVLGVTYQAIRRWEKSGCLPRTEWTGETDYASKIAAAVAEAGGSITKQDLLVRPSKAA
jgi:HD-like signal output (HDOD) protein